MASLTHPFLLVTILVAVIKVPDRSNVRKEEFLLIHSLNNEAHSPSWWENHRKEHQAAGSFLYGAGSTARIDRRWSWPIVLKSHLQGLMPAS